MATKKFLDANGVAYLVQLLDNYPDNEILGTVINAIQDALDEKADTSHTHLNLQTTAGNINTEYNLIGTLTSNTNNSAVTIYQPGYLSVSRTNALTRLTVGATDLPGHIRLYSNVTNATGYTDLISGATGTNARTITFPDASGTVALTSDIPASYDDTALAARVTALESIPWVTYYTGSSTPSNSQGSDGDLYFQTSGV